MSTTMEIGKKLVEMCKQHQFKEATEALYSPDVVSIEAGAAPGQDPKSVGIAAVKAKGEWWTKNHEVHSSEVTGPWPHGDRFAARFTMEVTAKAGPMAGKRMTLDEIALYTVKDGKIVHEEFFYSMGG